MFTVDGWSNFCRVFELPAGFPNDHCFNGGIPVNFQMVDWFNPVCGLGVYVITKEKYRELYGDIDTVETTLEELQKNLVPFIAEKAYAKKGRTYLVLCDFGAAFTVTGI